MGTPQTGQILVDPFFMTVLPDPFKQEGYKNSQVRQIFAHTTVRGLAKNGARYWVRTSDPHRVKVVLYR